MDKIQKILNKAAEQEKIDSKKRDLFYATHKPLFKYWINEFMDEVCPGKTYFSSAEYIQQ